MRAFLKPVKAGKTERYTYGLSAWLNGESLTAATVQACGAGVTLSTADIDGGNVGFFATGVTAGSYHVIVDYSTATRSDSAKVIIVVSPADSC